MTGAQGYEEAALRVLEALRLEDVLTRVLTVREVVSAAGQGSPGSFSRKTSVPELASSLAARAIGADAFSLGPAVAEDVGDAAAELRSPDAPLDLRVVLRDLAEAALEAQLAAMPDHRLILLAAACSAEPTTAARLHAHYAELTASLVPAYDLLLRAWGREPAAGRTIEDIARVLTALTDGSLLRAGFDDDAVDLFADAVVAVTAGLTVRAGLDAAERAGDPPAPEPDAGRVWPGSGAPLVERIATAARTLFAEGGWDAVTMTSVAERAGSPRVTAREVEQVIGHRGNLGSLALAPRVLELLEGATETGRAPDDALHACLERIHDFVGDNRAVTVALMASITTDGLHPERVFDIDQVLPFRPLVASLLEAAGHVGPPTAAELADALVLVVLHRSVDPSSTYVRIRPTVEAMLA